MKGLFITHAGPGIGGGHLSRSYALSQALAERNVSVDWLLNRESAELELALDHSPILYADNPFAPNALPDLSLYDFALIDSYVPPADFYRTVALRAPLVVIDDLNNRGVEQSASVLINYGIGVSEQAYRSPTCSYLIGPKYSLLRREYWELEPESGDYVLFAPGASDVAHAAKDMFYLWKSDMPPLRIVLGPLVPLDYVDSLSGMAKQSVNIEIVHAPPHFATLLARADFVFCSASVTAYEALALRKRTALFSVAANQEGLGEKVQSLGAGFNLGRWTDVDETLLRQALSYEPDDCALPLVCREGARLCARALIELLKKK